VILHSLYRGTHIISVFCVGIVGVFQADIIYVELAINRTSISSDARLTVCVENIAFIYILYNLFIYTFIYHCYQYLLCILEIFFKYPEYLLSVLYLLNISNFAQHDTASYNEKISENSCRENQNIRFVFNNTVSKICVFEIMWKNIVEPERSQMTI
jgi:hypothetical protein